MFKGREIYEIGPGGISNRRRYERMYFLQIRDTFTYFPSPPHISLLCVSLLER